MNVTCFVVYYNRTCASNQYMVNKHYVFLLQGGLKLKISALKIPKKPVPREEESSSSSSSEERDNSSSDEEADKSSDASQGSLKLPRKPIAEPVKLKEQSASVKVTMEVLSKDEDDKRKKIIVEEKKDVINKTPKDALEDKPVRALTNNTKLVKEETRVSVRGSARLANLRSDLKSNKLPIKVNNRTCDTNKNTRTSKSVTPTKSTDKTSAQTNNSCRLRSSRRRLRPGMDQDKSAKVRLYYYYY